MADRYHRHKISFLICAKSKLFRALIDNSRLLKWDHNRIQCRNFGFCLNFDRYLFSHLYCRVHLWPGLWINTRTTVTKFLTALKTALFLEVKRVLYRTRLAYFPWNTDYLSMNFLKSLLNTRLELAIIYCLIVSFFKFEHYLTQSDFRFVFSLQVTADEVVWMLVASQHPESNSSW